MSALLVLILHSNMRGVLKWHFTLKGCWCAKSIV